MENQPTNSILDKVMELSSERELSSFSPVDIVSELFRNLSSREQDILRRRFGLHGKGNETLEEIGKGYSVTRERIRQIENTAIRNIKSSESFGEAIKPVELVVLDSLEKHGGIMAEEHLLEYLLATSGSEDSARSHLLFLLEKLTSDRIVRDEHPETVPVWRVDFADWEKALATIAKVAEVLESHKNPLPHDELLNKFRETELYSSHREHFGFHEDTMEPVVAHIRMSKKLATNSFGEWGLSHWNTITPKRMGDKIYLVMKKHGEPLHFRNITEKINTAGFDAKRAYPPTVHNELILDERYVLVGRGIYALKEWGYIPGVVSDVIASILNESGALMRDEIVEKVLEQRMVKKGTVYLALANQERFRKNGEGKYELIAIVA